MPHDPEVDAHPGDAPTGATSRARPVRSEARRGRLAGHHLVMLVFCLPMLLVVGALVLTGAAGPGAIVYALLCAAMMAAMTVIMTGHEHWHGSVPVADGRPTALQGVATSSLNLQRIRIGVGG